MHSGTFLQQYSKVKGFEYFEAQQLINTHHKRLHLVFTPSERMNYTCTLWLGSKKFSKTFRQFKKPRCKKSGVKVDDNLIFSHCWGLQQEWFDNNHSMSVTSHRAACGLYQSTLLKCCPHEFCWLYTLKPTLLLWKQTWSSKRDKICCVLSKVHTKACLAPTYIATAWG
jgi:hypothetical protein